VQSCSLPPALENAICRFRPSNPHAATAMIIQGPPARRMALARLILAIRAGEFSEFFQKLPRPLIGVCKPRSIDFRARLERSESSDTQPCPANRLTGVGASMMDSTNCPRRILFAALVAGGHAAGMPARASRMVGTGKWRTKTRAGFQKEFVICCASRGVGGRRV